MKNKYAILFRLNNKIVQVNFLDQTEILLNSESKIVIYMDKKRQWIFYPLISALDSDNHEMTKRLRYTKQILMHMLTAKTHSSSNNQGTTITNSTIKQSQVNGH